MFDVQNNYLDKEDPWEGILEDTIFGTKYVLYHITSHSRPDSVWT